MTKSVYLCPAEKRHRCPWKGDMNDIYGHFLTEHDELLKHSNEVELDLSVKSENILMLYGEEIFLIQQRLEDDVLYIKLRFLGLELIASCITYHLQVVSYSPEDYPEIIARNGGWEIGLKSIKNSSPTITVCFLIDLKGVEQLNVAASNVDNEELIPPTENTILENIDVSDSLDTSKKHVSIQKNNSYTEGSNNSRVNRYLERSSRYKSVIVTRRKDKSSEFNKMTSLDDFSRPSSSIESTLEPEPQQPARSYTESDLPCASCKKIMLPPIYVCENEHSVCNNCKNNICGMCQENITNIRNTELENISRNCLHACKYSTEGCDQKFHYNELKNHEIKCNYCLYLCPLEGCPFQGTVIEFNNHMGIFHGNIKISTSLVNDCPKGSNFFVINKGKGIFLCSCKACSGIIEWQVIFCGPPERQFFCEVYFKNNKNKDKVYLKRNKEKYVTAKDFETLKKMKVKDKNAVLEISSYD